METNDTVDSNSTGGSGETAGAVGGVVNVQPGWVVPFVCEVRDLITFATLCLKDTVCGMSLRLSCGGMVGAAGWVHGLLLGPVTERDELPVTAYAAEAELATAFAVAHDRDLDAVRRYCASLGEVYQPPVLTSLGKDYARGAWWTLRWLLGQEDMPPMQLPLRHPNGRLVTADELYRVKVADEPDATAERRVELRRRATEMAEDSRALATTLHAVSVDMDRQP